MMSAAVADSDSVLPKTPALETESDAFAVSVSVMLRVARAVIESEAVEDSEIDAVITTEPESKYQPSEPLLVELVPAYHVVSRLYARTPVIAK